jgi:hypothetical protein
MVKEIEGFAESFTRAAFDAADAQTRSDLTAELATVLGERVARSPDLPSLVHLSVEALRALGHDLWRYDAAGDYEIWGPTFDTGPGLLITFARDGVRVTWRRVERPRFPGHRIDPALREGDPFLPIVDRALSQIAARLRAGTAIVLERLARGGGATHWYYCRAATDLAPIAAALRPGSLVSFYFDGRLRLGHDVGDAVASLRDQIRPNHDSVLGVLVDRVHLDVTSISSREELDEVASKIAGATAVVFGDYPAADNDGVAAVTLVLPDEDGVVRRHPY